MTDYKQLCADLLEAYEILLGELRFDNRLAKHASAALAQSEPEGPTVMQIIELADEIEAAELGQVDLVRAALARWGNHPGSPDSSTQPSKDLRWLEDLDERNVAAALRAAALYCKRDRAQLVSLADELEGVTSQ